MLSAIGFAVLGFTSSPTGATVDPATVQGVISRSFNISPLAFVPVIMIFALSAMRLSGFVTLMLSSVGGVVLAAFTQPDLITSIADDPRLSYAGAVLKTGIAISAHGFHLGSGTPQMDQLFSGGGTFAMFETVWLILVASGFGAIAGHTGMIQRVIGPVVGLAKSASALISTSVLTVFGLNVLAADSYVSIVLTAQMYRDAFRSKRLKPVVLSTAVADGGAIASPIIPWNVHGAFAGGALGMSVLTYAPFALLCYLQPLVTIVLAHVILHRHTLPAEADTFSAYGEDVKEEDLPSPRLSA
ncbi:MAG TPA: Na+/H+ antiporter NhaC family protein [Arthrobacter sp.]